MARWYSTPTPVVINETMFDFAGSVLSIVLGIPAIQDFSIFVETLYEMKVSKLVGEYFLS